MFEANIHVWKNFTKVQAEKFCELGIQLCVEGPVDSNDTALTRWRYMADRARYALHKGWMPEEDCDWDRLKAWYLKSWVVPYWTPGEKLSRMDGDMNDHFRRVARDGKENWEESEGRR